MSARETIGRLERMRTQRRISAAQRELAELQALLLADRRAVGRYAGMGGLAAHFIRKDIARLEWGLSTLERVR